jgi:hypothetical protein
LEEEASKEPEVNEVGTLKLERPKGTVSLDQEVSSKVETQARPKTRVLLETSNRLATLALKDSLVVEASKAVRTN